LTGGTDDGFVPSGGIESSIITPDLLLKEIDVIGQTGNVRPTPTVPPPAGKGVKAEKADDKKADKKADDKKADDKKPDKKAPADDKAPKK
jgi:hypothetical protein